MILFQIGKSQGQHTLIGDEPLVAFLGDEAEMSAAGKLHQTPESVKATSNQIILDWNIVAYEVMGGPAYQHPLFAARMNAMMHLAMHDALNAVNAVYQCYAFKEIDGKADAIAAAASAAYTILVASLPDKQSDLDAALTKSLAPIADGENKTRGIELGKKAGKAILTLRQSDKASENPVSPLTAEKKAGVYQIVPPFDFVYAPDWCNMKPFSVQTAAQFRCASHPVLNSKRYEKDFNEVKAIGAKNSTTRTADQTFYGKFWYELSEAGWNRIARTVAKEKNLGLMETARLFALMDMALIDSYITGWDSKYNYNFWRPYTAIMNATEDGNDKTSPETPWEPLMPTPPVPDYPSTHSTLGNAAAIVLANVFGDKTSFVFASPTAEPAGATRSFTSFSKAAKENADSRVIVGIHFRSACDAGLELGEKVGKWTVENYLQSLPKQASSN